MEPRDLNQLYFLKCKFSWPLIELTRGYSKNEIVDYFSEHGELLPNSSIWIDTDYPFIDETSPLTYLNNIYHVDDIYMMSGSDFILKLSCRANLDYPGRFENMHELEKIRERGVIKYVRIHVLDDKRVEIYELREDLSCDLFSHVDVENHPIDRKILPHDDSRATETDTMCRLYELERKKLWEDLFGTKDSEKIIITEEEKKPKEKTFERDVKGDKKKESK